MFLVALPLHPKNLGADLQFTAIGLQENKEGLVALQKRERGYLPLPLLYKISYKSGKVTKIKLPMELEGREIQAIFNIDSRVHILSQHNVEQGDNPTIHRMEAKGWKKLGEVACPSYKKFKLTKKAVKFSCIESDDKGKTKVVFKSLSVKAKKKVTEVEYVLPKTKITNKKTKIELMGSDFDWHKILLTGPDKKHEFSKKDFK